MLPAPERAPGGDAAGVAVAEPVLQALLATREDPGAEAVVYRRLQRDLPLQALDEQQSEAPEAPQVSQEGREEVGTPPEEARGVPDPIIATRA